MIRRRPACLAAAPFAGGLVFAAAFAPPALPLLIAAAILAAVSFILRKHKAGTFVLLAALACAGAGYYAARHDYVSPNDIAFELDPRFEPTEAVVTGVVASDPERRPHGTLFYLDGRSIDIDGETKAVRGRSRVTIYDKVSLSYGDEVSVRGKFVAPRPGRNPGAFDYRAFLRRRGTTALVTASDREDVTRISGGKGNPVLAAAFAVRRKAAGVLERSVGGDEAAVLAGLTLGKRSEIDAAIVEDFRRAGAMHLLAISGLHVGLVAFVLFLVLAGARVPRLAANLTVMAFLPAYALLTGFNPPVVRAAVMGVLALTAVLLDRDVDLFNVLAAAALIILIYNPLLVADASFLLSFAATFAIAGLYRPFVGLLRRVPGLLRESLAATAAAQLGVLPLQIYFFHHFTPVSLVSNLAMVPLAGCAVALSLATIVTGLVWPALGDILGGAAWLAAKLLTIAGHVFSLGLKPLGRLWPGLAGVPLVGKHLDLQFPMAESAAFVVAALLLGAAAVAVRKWRPGIAFAAAALGCLGWGFAPRLARADLPLRITFLDVGQADSALVEFPNGDTLLVDAGYAGGTYDAGERVVAPFLRAEGLTRIDYLCVTHGDADHAGGVAYLLREFDVGELWFPVDRKYSPHLREVAGVARERGVPVVRMAPAALDVGGAAVSRVWPPALGPPAGFSSNDSSTVLRLEYGEFSALLTGDVEDRAQGEILAAGRKVEADMLKAPHHGSLGAARPAFVAAVNPRAAFFATKAGAAKFPAAETLSRYRRAGALCLAAGEKGAAVVDTDGRRLRVRTMF
ncbi:MAG: DNA internalization-related competence protein ComEC/Rec2 [Candidatus Zixiibacteriota bacterium]|jgi:competence protein ComEC